MQLWRATLTVSLVAWSVLLTGHLQASPEVKTIFKSNRVLDLDKPVSIDHRIRRKRTAATAADQIEILRIHNTYRQMEGASDMYHLRWNGVLAQMAEIWAARCNFVHGQPFNVNTSSLDYTDIGQNQFSGTVVPLNLTMVLQQWFSEKTNYIYKNNSCAGKCGHYKQMVWATNYEIGCGYAQCPVLPPTSFVNAIYVVCNYGPGIVSSDKTPYQMGSACSNCSSGQYYCNKGLCDKTCNTSGPNCNCSAACLNCGTVTSTCRCKCTVGWSGDFCSKECKNYNTQCGANPGWPAKWCSLHTFVADSCPAMCGKCVFGTPTSCVTNVVG